MKKEDTVILECQCQDIAHRIRFVYDKEDNNWLCEMVSTAWTPWYRRLWVAIKYVFKFDVMEYAEVIIGRGGMLLLTERFNDIDDKQICWNINDDKLVNYPEGGE